MENKSYNWVSQSGLGTVDDMEVVDALELDPNVAYTKEINKAALQAAHKRSYQGYIDQGMDKKQAREHSNKDHQDTLNQIHNAEKLSGKKFI